MTYLVLPLILCILVNIIQISFGCCGIATFSICWIMRNNTSFERSEHDFGLWLNATNIKSIWKKDKFTSLTIPPTVEHKMTLQYGGDVRKWIFSIMPSTHSMEFRGVHKPQQLPSNTTMEALKLLSDEEVFACENSTLYLYQHKDFILAVGHTLRSPLNLESRSTSSLTMSWMEELLAASHSTTPVYSVSLYHSEMNAYAPLSSDRTLSDDYSFTGLESCSPYAACLAGAHSLICLSTITEPDVPTNLQVTSWNSTSVTVAWACPQGCKFHLFLITVFYLNGTDHVLEERTFRHTLASLVFTLSDLPPCSRVKFGLQTVCEFGEVSLTSSMVIIDGNTVHSDIEDLHQTSWGPDNYTLTWVARNMSSISVFRVYHQGVFQASTLLTTHTVANLEPCQRYPARVEALCGDSVVMSAKTVDAGSGPRGVLDLKYHSADSMVRWTAGTAHRVAFPYELSYENGSYIRRGRVLEPVLRLPGLTEGERYALDVWEDCGGLWNDNPALVCFDGVTAPLESLGLGEEDLGEEDPELYFDFSIPSLALVVPWSLAVPLRDPKSEPRAELERIVKNKLNGLMKRFRRQVRIQLSAFEEIAGESKTKIFFRTFDASITDGDLPLPVEEQLDQIQSLQLPNIAVKDGIIYWDDPDECSHPDINSCPTNSLCINTLDSYTCVCQHGYYDVASALIPPVDPTPQPVCHENGTFTQCLDRLLTGGVAKPFLIGYFGGKVAVVLNDGRCAMEESKMFYYFTTSRRRSQCGTSRRMNTTHIEFQNTLTVTLRRERTITRRDLKVIWKCVYLRNYVRKAEISVGLEWITSHSVVDYNSSHALGLAMTLYSDLSYTYSYRDAIALALEDVLFFEVALRTDDTFAPEVLLEVVSCWATESSDPEDDVKAFFLQDGCPVDSMFHWLSVNGKAQKSKFSLQMFTMPRELPIYFHCLARICRHDEDCTTNCTTPRLSKRSADQRYRTPWQAVVVSAGPLIVNQQPEPNTKPSNWNELVMMISIVGGTIGILSFTVLSVSATKAIMTYYERPRPQ